MLLQPDVSMRRGSYVQIPILVLKKSVFTFDKWCGMLWCSFKKGIENELLKETIGDRVNRNEVERSGVERSGVERNGAEWSGVERSKAE